MFLIHKTKRYFHQVFNMVSTVWGLMFVNYVTAPSSAIVFCHPTRELMPLAGFCDPVYICTSTVVDGNAYSFAFSFADFLDMRFKLAVNLNVNRLQISTVKKATSVCALESQWPLEKLQAIDIQPHISHQVTTRPSSCSSKILECNLKLSQCV